MEYFKVDLDLFWGSGTAIFRTFGYKNSLSLMSFNIEFSINLILHFVRSLEQVLQN